MMVPGRWVYNYLFCCISIVFVLYFYCIAILFGVYFYCVCFVFLLYLYADCTRVYTAHPPPFLEVAEPGSLPHKPRPTWDPQTLSTPCHSRQGPCSLLQAPQTKL